jgi:hypothetical protein
VIVDFRSHPFSYRSNSTNVALATRLQEELGTFPAAFFLAELENAKYYMDAASITQGLSWWSLYNKSHNQVSEISKYQIPTISLNRRRRRRRRPYSLGRFAAKPGTEHDGIRK